MRISKPSLRAGIGAAALLLAACRSTRDPGCAPDGSGGTGSTGTPGARASQPRHYPGQEPQQGAAPLADAGGWRLGGRGAKFFPGGADEEVTVPPDSRGAVPENAASGEFLTWPAVASWPPPGYRVPAAHSPRRSARPVQTARAAPKRQTPRRASSPQAPQESAVEEKKIASVNRPESVSPPEPPRPRRSSAVRPQQLTDIPRPGEAPAAEDALEKLRRRAEKSLSGD